MDRWWLVLALVACSKRDDDSDFAKRPPPPAQREPSAPASERRAAPAVSAGDEVTAMAVRGFLRIEDATGKHEEPLPESPRHHGEYPEGCYAAADGAVYAVGKQYTGVDGPDDGAVWKRAADGTWTTALRLELVQLTSIAGTAPDNIVAGGASGYSWWDGKTWTWHAATPSFVYVWSDGKKIFGTDFDRKLTFEIVKGEQKPAPNSSHDWRDDKYVCARGAKRYHVFEKDAPIGKRTLSPAEAAEIREETKQIEAHPENVRPVQP